MFWKVEEKEVSSLERERERIPSKPSSDSSDRRVSFVGKAKLFADDEEMSNPMILGDYFIDFVKVMTKIENI